MPPEIIPDDEDYASEEDSDFAPDGVPAEEKEVSSEEDESEADEPTTKPKSKATKRKRGDEEAEDLGFENSGDEAIIGEGVKQKKRRHKKAKAKGKSAEELEDDDGGEGGLIKTRSMRAQEKVEKKPLVDTKAATIDVDAVWEAMLAGKPISNPTDETKPAIEPSSLLSPKGKAAPLTSSISRDGSELRSPSTLSEGPDSMIMIKRTYNFAGKVHTEQKLVPRNSAEAKLFLASQPPPASEPTPEITPSDLFTKPKRPPKLARRSAFEPVVEGLLKRTDLHFGVRKDTDIELTGITGKEKKLNTVEKSAMDWAGFVDKAGIKDDLDAAGKSKGAYRARQEFLARVEQNKEEESRRARGLPV